MSSKNLEHSNTNLLLVDFTITLAKIKQLKLDFKEIITFDIKSDRLLSDNGIKHEVSDNIINQNELRLIDSACMNFCEWYNENNANELLSHESINLGSLFRIEFHNFLIPFLKNFIVINKILEKNPDTVFFCSPNLYQIFNKLTPNTKSLEKKSYEMQLTWDKIQYNLTDSISINVSKKNFQKLKKFSETVVSIFAKKNNQKKSKKSHALIEFDSIKYEKIFLESNNFKEKIFLYNRHRPIIYNRKSMNILKKSDIIPYISSKKSLGKIESKINSSFTQIMKNFEKLMDDDIFFSSFFQFNGISFWLSLKPYLIQFFTKKLLASINEIELAKKFLLDNKLSSLIVLSESGFTEQIMIKLANRLSINTILLQHGILLDNPSAINYNKIIGGNLPINVNRFFVWGDTSYNYAIESKCAADKIEIKGSPNLDRIFDKNKQNIQSSETVLLLATGPRDQQSVGHNVNEWKKYEDIIKKICEVVTKNNLNLIIKRHPDMAESDFSKEISQEFPNVKILKHGEISELLLISKIVISVGISSSIFESQILKKPVISIIADHDVYGSPNSVKQSCFETSINDFETNFTKLVMNSKTSQKIVENADKSIRKNFSNIGKSSKIILESLD